MTTWLVILLLAVMLSPLAWLMPSNRQRGKMALRLEARRLGLAMQLARQDWPHWLESAPRRRPARSSTARADAAGRPGAIGRIPRASG